MKPFRAWNNSLSNGLIKQLAKIHQEVQLKKKSSDTEHVDLFVPSKVLNVMFGPFTPSSPCSRELSFMHFVFQKSQVLSLWVFTCLY